MQQRIRRQGPLQRLDDALVIRDRPDRPVGDGQPPVTAGLGHGDRACVPAFADGLGRERGDVAGEDRGRGVAVHGDVAGFWMGGGMSVGYAPEGRASAEHGEGTTPDGYLDATGGRIAEA